MDVCWRCIIAIISITCTKNSPPLIIIQSGRKWQVCSEAFRKIRIKLIGIWTKVSDNIKKLDKQKFNYLYRHIFLHDLVNNILYRNTKVPCKSRNLHAICLRVQIRSCNIVINFIPWNNSRSSKFFQLWKLNPIK